MRRFELSRSVDETGVSGTGIVATGVQWPDGRCALRWDANKPTSTANYDSIGDIESIHGHGGKTRVVWLDTPPLGRGSNSLAPFCTRCFGGPHGDRGQGCPDCGSTGAIVYLPGWAVSDLRRHDKQRLAALRKANTELRALRGRLPVPAGVTARLSLHHNDKPIDWVVTLGKTSVTVAAADEEEARSRGSTLLSWLGHSLP